MAKMGWLLKASWTEAFDSGGCDY